MDHYHPNLICGFLNDGVFEMRDLYKTLRKKSVLPEENDGGVCVRGFFMSDVEIQGRDHSV